MLGVGVECPVRLFLHTPWTRPASISSLPGGSDGRAPHAKLGDRWHGNERRHFRCSVHSLLISYNHHLKRPTQIGFQKKASNILLSVLIFF